MEDEGCGIGDAGLDGAEVGGIADDAAEEPSQSLRLLLSFCNS